MAQERIFRRDTGRRRPAAEPDPAGARALAIADHRPQARVLQALRATMTSRPILQRAVETASGEFDTRKYKIVQDGQRAGATIELSFLPNEELWEGLGKVGMVQVNRRMLYKAEQSAPSFTDDYEKARATDQNWVIDRSTWSEDKDAWGFGIRNTSPVYQSQENVPQDTTSEQDLRLVKTLNDTGDEPEGRGRTWNASDPQDEALLNDTPTTTHPRYAGGYDKVVDEFETTALDLDRNVYLGSVRWGWEADRVNHKLKPTAIEKASDGDPTAAFVEAARKWNEQKFADYTSPEDEKNPLAYGPVKLPIPG